MLRYLLANLTLPGIARELHISHNTVKTHTRSLSCADRPSPAWIWIRAG